MTPFVPHSPAFPGALMGPQRVGRTVRLCGAAVVPVPPTACVLCRFVAPRPLPGSARTLLWVPFFAPDYLSWLQSDFVVVSNQPLLPGPAFLLFFPFSDCYHTDPHYLVFIWLFLLYLPPRSEADVLGTCLWPGRRE